MQVPSGIKGLKTVCELSGQAFRPFGIMIVRIYQHVFLVESAGFYSRLRVFTRKAVEEAEARGETGARDGRIWDYMEENDIAAAPRWPAGS